MHHRHARQFPFKMWKIFPSLWWLGLLLWSSLCAAIAEGQTPPSPIEHDARFPRLRFDHLGVDDGLSQQDVHAIVQDSLGFLWFGTEDGLNRYDGHTLRVFRPAPFDTSSLSGAWITGLAFDSDGGMWVATENEGLNRYNPRTEAFFRFPYGTADPNSLGSHNLWRMLRSRNGVLWLGTRAEGLTRFDPRTQTITHYQHDPDDPNGLGGNQITALAEDANGAIWIGTAANGLNRLNPATGTFTHYRHDPGQPTSLPLNDVRSLLVDHEGTLWIGTGGGGLAHFDPSANSFVTQRHRAEDSTSLISDVVTALLQTPDSTLWIGTDRGLSQRASETGFFTHYRHTPTDPNSLGAGAIHTLYLDRSGVFWIATETGLSRFVWSGPRFPLVTHDPDDANSLSAPGVWSFLRDRAGVLWVGTEAGLDRFDPATGDVTHYRHDPNDPSSLTPGWVVSIFEDSYGTFWVGTRSAGVSIGGLNRFDRTTGTVTERFIHDPNDSTSLRSDNPWRLFEDSQTRLWVLSGGTGCLNLMDRPSKTFTAFCHDPNDPNTPSYDAAKEIAEHPNGVLWLATWGGGLDRFNTQTGQWTHYRHTPDNFNSLADDYLVSLSLDSNGILWLGTYGAGLNRFDPETGVFTHFSEATSGLPNDVIYAVESDATGKVWVSSNRGLARLDPATGRFQVFGLEHGLQDLEFNVASYRAPNGELFFGGINGFNHFFPAEVEHDPTTPPVVLTDLYIRGQRIGIGNSSPLGHALPYINMLRLQADQRDFAVTFAALHFANPRRNRYRYRLDGYDTTWREAGAERTATYTNLDAGRYTFRVQAATGAGVWSDEGAVLALMIEAPWWQSLWAYTLYALALLAAGTSVYHHRRNRRELNHRLEIERVKAEKLRELNQAKSRFFANVSHEFRTPLTLTISPLDDLLNGHHGPLSDSVNQMVALARRNARRVLRLINQILDVARLEAGGIQLRIQKIDLGTFTDHIAQAFKGYAAQKSIALEVHIPDTWVVVWADPDQLEKMISNLLANALNYTPHGGTIRLTVVERANSVSMTVRDSGPGIPAEVLPHVFDRFYRASESTDPVSPGTGIGLALIDELVRLHGGSISVESEEGFGSLFTVTLPRGRNHFPSDVTVNDNPPIFTYSHSAISPSPALPSDHLDRIDFSNEDAVDATTVLIIEDHVELRAYLRHRLEPTYRVVDAPDGKEGLEQARSLLPDLILSDVMMPRMDGLSLCRALKSDPATDFIPIILLTAKAAPEDKIEGLLQHADDYLTKPFDFDELQVRIQNLIDSRRTLRERFSAAPLTIRAQDVEVKSLDSSFLDEVQSVIEARIADETFTVDLLAETIGLSRVHLYRRLNELTGQSPSALIRSIRLERAAQLLTQRAGTISEVAYGVGFKSVSHFSRSFRKRYGCPPSAYPDASSQK